MTRITTILASLSLVALAGACDKDDSTSAETTDETETAAKAETQEKAPEPTEKAEPKEEEKAEEVQIGEVEVEDLASWIEADQVAVFDSNGEKTRKEYGKIPTATLLDSSTDFDPSVLPSEKDKKLVFYCSNLQCGASKKSAKVAAAKGYNDVNILPVGVIGWKEAGQKTEKAL